MSKENEIYKLCWDIQQTAEIIWRSLNNLSENFKHTGLIDINIDDEIHNTNILIEQLEILRGKNTDKGDGVR